MKTAKSKKALAAIVTASMMAALWTAPAFAASEYDDTGATTFTFTDSAITAEDGDYTDYEIDSTDLKITGSGTYIVTGACADGSITVKKGTYKCTMKPSKDGVKISLEQKTVDSIES